MNSFTTRGFREMFAVLPASVQHQAREAYRLFRQTPAHPGLHFKRSTMTLQPIRHVGISYRAVGSLDGDAVVWFWIGKHADYDRLLDRL